MRTAHNRSPIQLFCEGAVTHSTYTSARSVLLGEVPDEDGPPIVPTDMDDGAIVVTPPAVHLSQAQHDDLASAVNSVRDDGPSTWWHKGYCTLLSLDSYSVCQ